MGTRNEKVQIVVSAKDKASSTLSKVKNQIVGIGAAYLGWRAVSGILSSITKAGMEHEKVWTEVAGALKRHGHEVDKGIKSIQKFADEMQTLTGISDETIGKGVQLFIDYGATIDEAKDTMKVAADLAAGSGMEMKAAVDLMAKAQVGYTGTLSRYGIILDESIPKNEKFAAAIEQINQKFGGAAADRMDTTAVKISLLSEKFGDLQEELFKIGAPALLGGVEFLTNTVSNLIGLFSDTSAIDRITDLRTEMESIGTKTQGLVTTYSQLITETNLNVTGQDALRTVTQQLADLVPTAVTAWDEYGNVVGVNTDKVNEYVEAQQAALKVEFIRSVSDLKTEFEELLRVQGIYRLLLDDYAELGKTFVQLPHKVFNLQEALLDANEALRGNTAGIERMLAVGSTAYPALATDVTGYKEAVQLLGQEFTDQIIAFQGQSEIRKVAIAAEFEQQKIGYTNNLYLQQQNAEWMKANASEMTEILTAEQELVNLSHEIGAEVGAQAYEELRINGEKSSRKRVNAMIAGVSKETKAFVDAKRFQIQMGEQFKAKAVASMRSLVSQSVDAMIDGRGKIGDIFKAMAVDFTKFFIKQALAAIANLFIPGLGSLLGGIFDTPRYDLMAMEQGRHFAQHFTRGALGETGGFPNQFVPTIASYNPMLNAANGPMSGGNIYITVSADVDEGSVRSKIAPILEELANNKFTNIVNDESTMTGESAIEFA